MSKEVLRFTEWVEFKKAICGPFDVVYQPPDYAAHVEVRYEHVEDVLGQLGLTILTPGERERIEDDRAELQRLRKQLKDLRETITAAPNESV
jgi:hypothetical protein